MQIGYESDAETLECFGNVTVSKVVVHDTVYARIGRREFDCRRGYLCATKHPVRVFVVSSRFLFFGFTFLAFRDV